MAERPETKSIIVTQAVQDYAVAHSSAPPDEVQRSLIEATHELGGVSRMQISPDQGAFMTLLTRLVGATLRRRGRHLHRVLVDLHRPRPRQKVAGSCAATSVRSGPRWPGSTGSRPASPIASS